MFAKALYADPLRLDPKSSRFTVQAFASGFLAGFGHSPTFAVTQFEGELNFSPAEPDNSTLALVIAAASLNLIDKLRDSDRAEILKALHEQVLESGKYPTIDFRSTRIAATRISDAWYRLQIQGDIGLHGLKKPQDIDVQLRIVDESVRLGGAFTLSQSAFRIKPPTGLGGMIKVKDELKFTFDVVGRESIESR